MPRPNLRQGLDRDVYAIITKLEESSDTHFTTVTQAYDAIKRSNSHISRQKRRPLEDSIDRVLQFRKEELHDSDSEAAIEQAEAQLPKKPEDERFLLNRQLTKNWNTRPADRTPSTTVEAGRPKKRRKMQNDREDRQSGSEKMQTNGVGEDTADRDKKKTQRPSRFTVEFPSASLPLGGMAPYINDLEPILDRVVRRSATLAGERKAKGLLLTGPRGVGKRTLVKSLCGRLELPVISIRDCFLDPERMEKALVEAFDEAAHLAPSIILADDMELYLPRHDNGAHGEPFAKAIRIFLQQRERMFRELPRDKHVMIIGTSTLPTELHPELCLGYVFVETFQIRTPILEAREDIFRVLLRDNPRLSASEIHELAEMAHGFVGLDIHNVIERAQLLDQVKRADDAGVEDDVDSQESPLSPVSTVRLEQIKAVMRDHVPCCRREGFSTIPKVSWDNVGAMVEARKQLDLSIIGPIKDPWLFEQFSLGQSAGVLLWGPPGCGKTLVAQAVANEAQASFIAVSGPELLNKYVGESERAVRELFQRARSSTPCILFFDEMDALAPKRDDASNAGVRIVTALLTEMDGVHDRTGVYIIGTTNRPDMIDPAMLRPGRLSTAVFVDLPTEDERVQILQTIYRVRQPAATAAENALIEGIARDKRCEGFSGADLSGLYYKAAEIGVQRWRDMVSLDPESRAGIIAEDWEAALQKTKRSVSNPAEYARIQQKLAQAA